jgi:hypothetical protein
MKNVVAARQIWVTKEQNVFRVDSVDSSRAYVTRLGILCEDGIAERRESGMILLSSFSKDGWHELVDN